MPNEPSPNPIPPTNNNDALTIHEDYVHGDKVGDDKVSGDKVGGSKITINVNVTQKQWEPLSQQALNSDLLADRQHNNLNKLIHVEQFLPDYKAWVTTQCNRMQILDQEMPLTNVYTDVYMVDKQAYWSGKAKEEQQTAFTQRASWVSSNRQAGVDLLANYKRLFIVGQPGSGKTTFMRWLALQTAQDRLPIKLVPVYVELRRFNSFEGDLTQLIIHQLALGGWTDELLALEKLLANYRLLILLDGLDEVLANKRHILNEQIADLAKDKRLEESLLLITCRPYAETRQFEGFTYVKIADFTPKQVAYFIQHWFANEPESAENLLTQLKKNKHKAIQELTRTPLLLALLCIVYNENPEFPTKRHELYQRASRVVLTQWDDTRGIKRESVYGKFTSDKKAYLLAWIAYHTFEQGQLFIPKKELMHHITICWKKWRQTEIQQQIAENGSIYDEKALLPREVDADKIITEIASQHGLLVVQGDADYSFSHLTLQEYFTALYIVENNAEETVSKLMAHVGDIRWREVFLLTAGLLPDMATFTDNYLQALDVLIRQDEQVLALAQWGVEKSTVNSKAFSPASSAFYLYLAARGHEHDIDDTRDIARAHAFAFNHARDIANALEIDLESARSLVSFDDIDRGQDLASVLSLARTRKLDQKHIRNLDLEFDRVVDLARVYVFADSRNLGFDIDHDFDDFLALDQAISLARARSLDMDIDFVLDLDHAFDYLLTFLLVTTMEYPANKIVKASLISEIEHCLAELIAWSRELKLTVLAEKLERLTSLPEEATASDLQTVGKALREIAIIERNIGNRWELSQVQWELLAHYLEANQLLIECLQAAISPPWEMVRERILMVA